jgi:hypothetical protein
MSPLVKTKRQANFKDFATLFFEFWVGGWQLLPVAQSWAE